jgi:hypothetical protein
MSKKDVATLSDSPGALTAPDFMKDYASEGMEGLTNSAFAVPRIALLQALNPQCKEYRDQGAADGVYWHLLQNASLGRKFRVIPIYASEQVILWRPRDDGGGILAQSRDCVHWDIPNRKFKVKVKSGKTVEYDLKGNVRESGLTEFGTADPGNENDNGPAASIIMSYVVTIPDKPELSPAVLSFQRTGLGPARAFNTTLKQMNRPIYGVYVLVDSVVKKNAKGEFNIPRFQTDGFVQDKGLFDSLREQYLFFKKQGVEIKDAESLQGEESEAKTEAPQDSKDAAY